MLILVDAPPPGAPPGDPRPFTDPTLAAIPLGPASQLTVASFEYADPAGRGALAVLPCLAPTVVSHGRSVAAFAAALASCFPDAALPPPAPGGASGGDGAEPTPEQVERQLDLPVPATPVIAGAELRHHGHTPSDAFAGAVRLVPPAGLEAAGVPPHVAAGLRAAYAGAPWSFLCAAVPPGGRPTTVAVAVECGTPVPGFLHVPTRVGVGATGAATTPPDGTWAPPPEGGGEGGGAAGGFVPWGVHVITAGSARRGDWAGGGKDPATALDDSAWAGRGGAGVGWGGVDGRGRTGAAGWGRTLASPHAPPPPPTLTRQRPPTRPTPPRPRSAPPLRQRDVQGHRAPPARLGGAALQ